MLLQGHCNPISAVTVSADKRWIATADSAEDALVIVWDASSGQPIRTIQLAQPHEAGGGGLAALDMSADSTLLATLSQSYPQVLSVWEWTVEGSDAPAVTATLDNTDYQHCVRINPNDSRDLVTNGPSGVVFWRWEENDKLVCMRPPAGVKGLQKGLGALTHSTYIPYTTKVITAAVTGHVIMWDFTSKLAHGRCRQATKILQLVETGGGINTVKTLIKLNSS